MWRWYARVLTQYSVYFLVLVAALSIGLSLWVFAVVPLPDFKDPILGFTTRGTDIMDRILAWKNLEETLQSRSGLLYRYPAEHPELESVVEAAPILEAAEKRLLSGSRIMKRSLVPGAVLFPQVQSSFCHRHTITDDFGTLAQVVIHSDDLRNVNTLRWLCIFEQKIYEKANERMGEDFVQSRCVGTKRGKCCEAWHLASIAAYFSRGGRRDRRGQDCSMLKPTEVTTFWSLIEDCWPQRQQIVACWHSPSPKSRRSCLISMPSPCRVVVVFWLLNFILEADLNLDLGTSNGSQPGDFVGGDGGGGNKAMAVPGYTMLFLPFAQGHALKENDTDWSILLATAAQETNEQLKKSPDLADSDVIPRCEFVGMQFGIRFALFDEYLLRDASVGILALCLVLISTWLYTGSLCFTVSAVLGVVFSVGVAYFVYTLVCGVRFFPFMNLLIGILLIGIGADDTFVLRRVWCQAKTGKNPGPLLKIVYDTLSHACLSMFVTSLTTAAAFLANYVSSVIVIKCFGLFAAITVLVHYVLMIIWLPACIVMIERSSLSSCLYMWSPNVQLPRLHPRNALLYIVDSIRRRYGAASDWGRIMFEKILPCVVIKFRYVWLTLFSVLSILSGIAVFHTPGLQVPRSNFFKLFKPSHPIERYYMTLRRRFLFRRAEEEVQMPIRVVWGLRPTTTASTLQPHDRGRLEMDPAFNFHDSVSLFWLRNFCQSLAMQNFTSSRANALDAAEGLDYGASVPFLAQCFVDDFLIWMRRPCLLPPMQNRLARMGLRDGNAPCCENSTAPYLPETLVECLWSAAQSFRPSWWTSSLLSGPLFLNQSKRVGAIVVQFFAKQHFTISHANMHTFYEEVNSWVRNELDAGPVNMRNGWFVSHLELYDLQVSLRRGTTTSVLIAVAVAFCVLLLSTQDVLLSLLSILSISSIIFVTIACIIMLGWELNVLESTIVILTVGLSFDYTLHYAVAYRVSYNSDRETKVVYAIGTVGSAIFMSALTTFLAGLSMMLAQTMAYYQIGIFMMLITSIGWLYATFFFTSLLYVWGPLGHAFDLRYYVDRLWRARQPHKSRARRSRPAAPAPTTPTSTTSGARIPLYRSRQRSPTSQQLTGSVERGGSVERESTPQQELQPLTGGPMSVVAVMESEPQPRVHKKPSWRQALSSSLKRAKLSVSLKKSNESSTNGGGPNGAGVSARQIFADPDSQALAFIDDELALEPSIDDGETLEAFDTTYDQDQDS